MMNYGENGIAHPKHLYTNSSSATLTKSRRTLTHQRSYSDAGSVRNDAQLRAISPRYDSLPLAPAPAPAAKPISPLTINVGPAGSFNKEMLPGENAYVVFRSVVATWDADDASDWIHNIGFPDLAPLFMIKGVTGLVLLELNYDLLREMGVAKVGTRAKVLHAIKELILDDARMEPLAWNGNVNVQGLSDTGTIPRGPTIVTLPPSTPPIAPEGPTVVVSNNTGHGVQSSRWNSLRRRSPDRQIRLLDDGVSSADAVTETESLPSRGSFESEETRSTGSWDRVRRLFTTSPRSASSYAPSPKNLQPPAATLLASPSPTRAWQPKLNIPSNSSGYAGNPPSNPPLPITNNTTYPPQSSSAATTKRPATPINPLFSGGRNLAQSIAAQVSSRFPKSLGTDSYFGERPPDNVIAANLESFFPDLQEESSSPTTPGATSPTATIDMESFVTTGNLSPSPLSSPSLSTSRNYIPSVISITSSAAALNQAKRSSRTIAEAIKPRVQEALARKLERASFMRSSTRSAAGSPQFSSSYLNSVQSPYLSLSFSNSSNKTITPLSRVSVSSRKSVNWVKGPLIGQGAFGKVYYAVNKVGGEIMAVKQVSIGDEDDKVKKSREKALASEMGLLSTLDHPNIVRYFGHEVTDTFFNVFLEYVPGGSISTCLSKYGKFEEDLARSLTYQILCGLSYLHDGGIIHRDIKAANILLDDFGCAKISDFGISKRLDSLIYESNSRHSIQGSIYWMAPEVARNQGYSAKVDIWGLGCLALEMLTGHHPWHKVPGHILYLLGTGKTPPLPDDITTQARDFITRCFTVDAEKRPTVSDCLLHTFAIFDPDTFNFAAWAEMASERVLNESTYGSALNSNFKMVLASEATSLSSTSRA
ncbi:hypothetical protein SeMB42_g05459 [Synchytrium endobioticum]|uniref:Protein kinase domain-containing protein n=1 Tax=Synchytrium endobioticum TaxID=286115 RepID=A0A507D340_9FUNG|nr:hypothetical protein SeMB42_g05459 [Synchytrium endobioticum]TPX45668.1 hypothetical protein SeLEV6574_g03739 [Synchytrium endobioticum]